jgi:hypothetical protein
MTRRFLDHLFADVQHPIELRAWTPADRVFTTPGHWQPFGRFITHHVNAGRSIAVGIATRRDTSSGTAANLAELPALWVDIDSPPATVAALFDGFPFRWSLIVHSGLNVHAYLKLREPLDLQIPGNLHRAASILRRLSGYCGGDDQCTDPARVMRLPGTFNRKYGRPRPVVLAEHSDAVVNLEELEDFLPQEIVRANQMEIERAIPTGLRNDTLYRIARSLRARQIPIPAIDTTIRILNDIHCDEPLDEPELRALIQHACFQPDRPDFVPTLEVLVAGSKRRRR